MFMVGGFYLAFFFILSHNFEGVYMFDKSNPKEETSFLRKQVMSSSNVGGAWLAFLNGGLNYQIEHHLFPRMQHSHYAMIAPVVREFCLSRGIPYRHFPTIGDNVASCIKHLALMGSQLNPVSLVQ
jgi:fatty acid desaturase (delta-4 desaturase)